MISFFKFIILYYHFYFKQMALILNHPRVYSFLHIPIQSASDAVLADMKREYSSDDFRRIVDYLREKLVVLINQ
jgi:threonylcarbamoyladenosine tRNA methylthiotransferase CDKAL1